ncbi:peptidoglycan-binding domain-containing protein [Nocardia sp. NPDC051787]|uniref:peptidoglycan-binding domain-containing protein n=1 Tax=Nocardia sp. NPDC051787 TaxID=3155415 RepID=UPI00344242A5
MRSGDSGSGVIALQKALNKCYKAGLSEDGKFGPRTRSALMSAQKDAKTDPDGIFGPDTRAKMEWPFYKDRPENGDYPFSVCRRL